MTAPSSREWPRQLVHCLCGLGAFLLWYWPKLAVIALLAAGALLVFVTDQFERHRGRKLNPLLRPGESVLHNGAIRYAIGVAIAIALFSKFHAFLGWIIFAVGDSASTICGRAWPIRQIGSRRSLGGFLGFLVVSVVVATLANWWWTAQIAVRPTILIACTVCGLAELFVTTIDDNYYLPSLGAAILYLLR